MSQNMTVNWRRSAAEAAGFVVAGREAIDPAGSIVPAARLAPQLEQNFAPAELACPHARHGRGSAIPHCSQNLPTGTFALQLGHCMAGTSENPPYQS
jgi:hypothetical protein